MSTNLEAHAVYLLPDAMGGDYLILRAEQVADGWRLIESHDTPGGSDRFRARAGLPPEDLFAFRVTPAGELEPITLRGQQHGSYTLDNLSVLGYLHDGRFTEVGT